MSTHTLSTHWAEAYIERHIAYSALAVWRGGGAYESRYVHSAKKPKEKQKEEGLHCYTSSFVLLQMVSVQKNEAGFLPLSFFLMLPFRSILSKAATAVQL